MDAVFGADEDGRPFGGVPLGLGGLRLVPEVNLRADQDDGRVGAILANLRYPFVLGVPERLGGRDGVAQKKDVTVDVG